MNEYKTEKIKALIAQRIKELKGETSYTDIAKKCNIYPGKISNVANNKIDCQLSSLIEIATGLRVHPRQIFEIMFDFEDYYANLDGISKNKKTSKRK
ncbi:hypothetical protein SAMN03080594_102360 [Arenibacter palladensis]|uniref:HTH cro/C1-type domain-containing protein n=2 Tax=Arenibacter palladensis TaxID=237373 RepID=A0A1M4Y8S7_9FLAO|nr:hypothetical protein SAMN03080594_102360 [Arenibacter palladensis]